MYTPGLTDKELAEMDAAGLSESDFQDVEIDVWPENEPAYYLFLTLQTQWRVGMGGATGLDYAALPVALRMIGAVRAQWRQLMADVRVMELAALAAMAHRGD